MRTIGLTLFTIIIWQLCLPGQANKEKIAVAAPKTSYSVTSMLQAPREISASDGIYDKFVLIRWEPTENATFYKVFRTTDAKAKTFQEISNSWQKSTWLCDYSALPNVDYYYTVVASDGKQTSPMSLLDKGFLKKQSNIAIDDRELLAENEAYGSQRQIFLLIAGINLEQEMYRSGEKVKLTIGFQNIFDQPTPRSEVRYFLSQDGVLDWNDRLLGIKSLSSIPPNSNFLMTETLLLPNNLLPGSYHIIAVSSPEGAILSSKIALTVIKIVRE